MTVCKPLTGYARTAFKLFVRYLEASYLGDRDKAGKARTVVARVAGEMVRHVLRSATFRRLVQGVYRCRWGRVLVVKSPAFLDLFTFIHLAGHVDERALYTTVEIEDGKLGNVPVHVYVDSVDFTKIVAARSEPHGVTVVAMSCGPACEDKWDIAVYLGFDPETAKVEEEE